MKKIDIPKMHPHNKNEYALPLNKRELHMINDACSLLVDRTFKLEMAPIRNLSTTSEVGASLKFLEKIGVAILELESLMSPNLAITTNVNFTIDELLTIREIAVNDDPTKRYKPGHTLKIKVLKLLFDESLEKKIKTSEMFDVINRKEDSNE